MTMLHEEVVQALERFAWEGEAPPDAVWHHLALCGACLQGLGLICETIERGNSGWLDELAHRLPCAVIQGDLYRHAAIEQRQLARTQPAVAAHLGVCDACSTQYLAARSAILAELEGLFGPPLVVPNVGTSGWNELTTRMFTLVSDVTVAVRRELIGFVRVPPAAAGPAYALAPAGNMRSAIAGDVEQPSVDAVEVGVDLTPPNLGHRLRFRFVPEADGHISLIVSAEAVVDNITLLLYQPGATRALLEVRGLSSRQLIARLDRLPAGSYEVEIRAPEGTAIVPLAVNN